MSGRGQAEGKWGPLAPGKERARLLFCFNRKHPSFLQRKARRFSPGKGGVWLWGLAPPSLRGQLLL